MNDGDGTMPDCKVERKEKKIGNNNDLDWESKAQHLYECTRWICFAICCLAFHTFFRFGFGFGLSPSYSLFISFKIELSCHDNRQNINNQKPYPRICNFLTWTHFANSIWVFLHIFQFNSIVVFYFELRFVFTRKQNQIPWFIPMPMNEWMKLTVWFSQRDLIPCYWWISSFFSLWLAYGSCRPHH